MASSLNQLLTHSPIEGEELVCWVNYGISLLVNNVSLHDLDSYWFRAFASTRNTEFFQDLRLHAVLLVLVLLIWTLYYLLDLLRDTVAKVLLIRRGLAVSDLLADVA